MKLSKEEIKKIANEIKKELTEDEVKELISNTKIHNINQEEIKNIIKEIKISTDLSNVMSTDPFLTDDNKRIK